MTSQRSDRLEMDDQMFMVRDYISEPTGIDPPPRDPHYMNTGCWRGYTSRWAIREVDGEKRLFLLGFDSCDSGIDGYFPLVEPVMNPISEKIRVAAEDAECLSYVHMGFESKYAGEKYLVFQWGRLTGIEEIPDDVPNEDGIYDIAGLYPGGKDKGRKEIERILSSYSDEEEEIPVHETEKVCYACNSVFLGPENQEHKDSICPSCGNDLVAVGKSLNNWRCRDEPGFCDVSIYATNKGISSQFVNPEWFRKSRLSPFGDLKFGNGRKNIILNVSGRNMLIMRERPEESHDDEPLNNAIKEFITAKLTDHPGIEIGAHANSYGSSINVGRDFQLSVPTIIKDGKIDAKAIAESIERTLDEIIEKWVAELLELVPVLKKAWRQGMASITGGTGIYPFDPSKRTPRDEEIIWNTAYYKLRLDEKRKWATPPRHTKDGWQPGVKVMDLYMSNLNI